MADAEHLPRPTVGVAIHHLRGREDQWRSRQHRVRAFLLDCIGVFGHERNNRLLRRAVADRARQDHQHVGAQAFELTLHQRGGALTQRDHGGDGGDADHHAQQRKPGPHLVLRERPQGDSHGDEKVH